MGADRYSGSVAIVTGAADGIGRAVVEGLLAEGAFVVANDIDEQAVEKLRSERLLPVPGDISDPDTPELIVSAALEQTGRIDALFNNAGIGCFDPALDLDPGTWRRTMAVNLDSCFAMAAAVGSVMVTQGGGAILNTASAAGVQGLPTGVAYVASKHGVVGITRALAIEWGRHGIRVNALCPGFTETGMNRRRRETDPAGWTERERLSVAGRAGRADEQAAMALFLNSSEASYVSGQIAVVDAGEHSLYAGRSHELR